MYCRFNNSLPPAGQIIKICRVGEIFLRAERFFYGLENEDISSQRNELSQNQVKLQHKWNLILLCVTMI